MIKWIMLVVMLIDIVLFIILKRVMKSKKIVNEIEREDKEEVIWILEFLNYFHI